MKPRTKGQTAPLPPVELPEGLVGGLNYLSTVQAGKLLGLSPLTMKEMRHRGDGPIFIKLGPKRVAYLYADILTWIESRRRRSTSDCGPEGSR